MLFFHDKHLKEPLIYLNIDRLHRIIQLCEEFLLSSEPMEKSLLYKRLELKKDDKEYLDCVKKGLELVEKDNKDKSDMFKIDKALSVSFGLNSGYDAT